jgi:hypothetical protein
MMRRAHEVMADQGALEFLRDICGSEGAAHPAPIIAASMHRAGVIDSNRLRDEMLAAQLLQRLGEGFGPSRHGRRVSLLLDAINGGNLEDIFTSLRRLTDLPEAYELVRNKVTALFFESLYQRPGFQRLYICSPWIHLSKKEIAILKHALVRMQEKAPPFPEIRVITLPDSELTGEQRWGVKPLTDLGAEVVCHPRLHTKLYIREPGAAGGPLMAIVGSKNLTQTNNLELGIQINGDTRLIYDLIRYFYDLAAICKEGRDA